jgi:RNA polymerase sigma-70 factor (ECF subfamily)
MAAAPRMDSSVLDRHFDRSRAEHWDVPRDRFEAAIAASVDHAFSSSNPTSAEVSAFLDDLHVEDLALAIACESGSERAWEHFIAEYRPVLQRAADAIDPRGNAREVADAIFAELYGLTERDGVRRSLLRYFHGRSRLGTWLRAILSQRWIDRVRATRRSDPLPDEPDTLPAPSGRGASAGIEQDRFHGVVQRALTEAIAALPARDRLRLSCYYAQGMKLAAIGKLLHEHEATVSRQLSKARDTIAASVRTALERDHGMDERTAAECLQSVMDDTGALDVNELIGAGARKKSGAGRSTE